MYQKIENTLHVTVEGTDLTTARGIEFYVRQDDAFFEYTPEVINSSEMVVTIPKEDADVLRRGSRVYLQFALTDEHGNDIPSMIETKNVKELLKEEGYYGY